MGESNAGDIVPLRIDRCLVRGLECVEARALTRAASDHRPIVVRLDVMTQPHPWPLRRLNRRGWPLGLRRAASRDILSTRP